MPPLHGGFLIVKHQCNLKDISTGFPWRQENRLKGGFQYLELLKTNPIPLLPLPF